ncbi:MAG: response regulator receiver (CheY-like) modulated diguanylate phosphodiesterase domain [Ramlibacter sp.]|nr:response regulator receiver (CheY-like) modulated diguanylate phosphodiesterase domain [Ramlibacter sp.]
MPCKNLSFLVVEDHEFQRRCLVQLLTALGAQAVHSAPDGEAALKVIANVEAPIDIVICDVTMPGMDGMEFIRHWSERGDPTSLILMSAIEPALLATVANMALAYKVGLLGVLSKPATAAKLTGLIELHRSQTLLAAPREDGISFQQITEAWTSDEFECWFEPRVNLATGVLRSMCAVPRWRHPTLGVLEPQAFMPSIRARGLGDDFAWLHLQQAVTECRRWQRQGDGLVVSVNLAFQSLADVSLAPRIHHILQGEGLEPRFMVLSIEEAALGCTELAQVLETLARLRLLGFGLAIDDFGMGPMAMDRLSLAAFTELKIRSSFVVGADCNESARAGLAVALEAALELKVASVATGIASKHEWNLLYQWGCRFGQGPFIAPPMPGADVPRWLARWHTRRLQSA